MEVDEDSVGIRIGSERNVADGAEACWGDEGFGRWGGRSCGGGGKRRRVVVGRRRKRGVGAGSGFGCGKFGVLIGRFVDEVRSIGVAVLGVFDREFLVVEVSGKGVDDSWGFGSCLGVEDDVFPSVRTHEARKTARGGAKESASKEGREGDNER